MPLQHDHKVHLGNGALFVILLGLLALPFVGLGAVRYESADGGVLSDQDVYVEEEDLNEKNDSTPLLPARKFVKYKVEEAEIIADDEKEATSSVEFDEFDPVNYPPANIVLPE